MQPHCDTTGNALSRTGTGPGFTLLELLIVLACLAIATGFMISRQPSRLHAAADALRTLLVQGRLEAVSGGVPVVITFDTAEREFRLRAAGSGPLSQACDTPGASSSLKLQDYRGVTQASTFKDLIWLPTGLARSCSGAGGYTHTVRLLQGTREARVLLSRAGRVRSEVVPR